MSPTQEKWNRMWYIHSKDWSGLPFPSPMHEREKWKWSRSVVSDSSDPMDYIQPNSSPQYSRAKISLASFCWIPKVTGFIFSLVRKYNDKHKLYSSRILKRVVQASYWKGASPCGHWESPRKQNRIRFCFSGPHSSLSCTLDVERMSSWAYAFLSLGWILHIRLPSISSAASSYVAFRAQHSKQDFHTPEWSSCLPVSPIKCRPHVNRGFIVYLYIYDSNLSAPHTIVCSVMSDSLQPQGL